MTMLEDPQIFLLDITLLQTGTGDVFPSHLTVRFVNTTY